MDASNLPAKVSLLRIAKELAGKLGKDETALADELITLAGKIPSDLAETLSRNPEVVRLLRSVGSDIHSASDWRKLFSDQSPDEQPRKDDYKVLARCPYREQATRLLSRYERDFEAVTEPPVPVEDIADVLLELGILWAQCPRR